MKRIEDELLFKYLDGDLNADQLEQIKDLIIDDEELAQRIASLRAIDQSLAVMSQELPSDRLKSNFYKFLEKEKGLIYAENKQSIRIVNLRWMVGVAAGLLILITGYFIYDNNQKQDAIQSLNFELAQTKDQMLNALQSASTSSRIHAVNRTYEFKELDQEIFSTLVKTFQEDDNAMVRLAALEAISNYGDAEVIKTLVKENLIKEQDATIQISMIHLLTNIEPEDAKQSLEALLDNENILEEVKGEAQMSLYKIESYRKM